MEGTINTILVVDCGSTTTKAILIQREGEDYRLKAWGEAPSTLEKPFEDVTLGVRAAIRAVEELSNCRLMDEKGIITPGTPQRGTDLFLATSSAGGGLQMMAAGVDMKMISQSAQGAALGSGALVMELVALDDRRLRWQKFQRIQQMRPDMVLVAGGADGDIIFPVLEMVQFLAAADLRPRLDISGEVPVIYCGNQDARMKVTELLRDKTDLRLLPNIRPVPEREVLGPVREEITSLFMEHVMGQAPGYNKLLSWTKAPIIPTPTAVGNILQAVADELDINVIGVDLGGATTEVFSAVAGAFNRTVSADLGMSYRIGGVMAEAGLENIMRWLPFPMEETELRNRIRNKMFRPTTIPHTLEELLVEQAIAREALRLAFSQHKGLAAGLKGIQRQQTSGAEAVIDMMAVDMLVGSGGVLSRSPRRVQSAVMMLDALLPEGVTRLAVDSNLMMPQLGVLSAIMPQEANQVFERDCLLHLGSAITPRGKLKAGEVAMTVKHAQGELQVKWGDLQLLPAGEAIYLEVVPHDSLDIGGGRGKSLKQWFHGGECGIFLDCRGRPLELATEPKGRTRQLLKWFGRTNMYPMVVDLAELEGAE